MTFVFDDSSIKGNEKLLMLSIADNCNDSGVAFPSWKELMRKTSMSKGSISKWIKSLEKKNLLFRVTRKRKNGSSTSNKYLIYPYKNKDILDEEDYLIFKDLYHSSEVEHPSSEVEHPNGGQSSEVEHLEPSLISFNHNIKPSLIDKINIEALNEWINLKGKKYSQLAVTKCINFLCKYDKQTQQEIIDTSIMNGWQGLFPPKQTNNNKPNMSFKQQDAERTSHAVDVFMEARKNGFSIRDLGRDENKQEDFDEAMFIDWEE